MNDSIVAIGASDFVFSVNLVIDKDVAGWGKFSSLRRVTLEANILRNFLLGEMAFEINWLFKSSSEMIIDVF